ncbi:Hypothetical protein NTJ_12318 [Nesidiocoris tenuis]|uniref:Uncharacterized protein n=1 Tax=Nesidiocoris tenuis TaxID=355587 RepID=A0ABN7B519_9HEMI|nr:Hypothetical protein NTJ_12318 [Nesidiocoris tenuis]
MALRTKKSKKHNESNDSDDNPVGEDSRSGPVFRYSGPPPEKFDPGSEDWSKWFRRYERYYFSSGLYKEPDQMKINVFMTCIGKDGEDILDSFRLAVVSYANIVERFRKYYVKRSMLYSNAFASEKLFKK